MIGNKFLSVTGGEPTDAQFNYVTLLLNGDGTNGAQNNTFLDSSTNNFTITRNGNTTQGSFSPYGSNWSNYFDGSGDYLQLADSTDWDLTGDYTIEAWIFPTATPVSTTFFQIGTDIYWYLAAATKYVTVTGSLNMTASTALSLSTWNHVALVRSGSGTNNTVMYLNGVNVAQTTNNTSFTGSASNGVRIGAEYPTGYEYNGYISNLRLLKGTAAYSGNFTPSTTPFATSTTNQKLLTCASNGLVDSNTATAAKTITVNGTPSVQRFSPFNPTQAYSTATIGGSGYFDGTGDYLTVADNAVLDMGSSDFTMECWIYPLVSSSTAGQTIFSKRANNGSYGGILLGFWNSNLQPSFYATFNGSSWGISNVTSSIAFKPYSWNHVALTRSGSTWTIWVNGQSGNTASNAGTVVDNSAAFAVGASGADGSDVVCASYITDARIIKGAAVYTGAFTPPSLAPLATSGSASAASYPSTTNVNTSFASSATSLLTSMTNAGIPDSAMMNDLETVGNAQVSTSVKKYGTGSLAFDGTGDGLLCKQFNQTFSGDFTVEFWIYRTGTSVEYPIDIYMPPPTDTQAISMYINNSGAGSYNAVFNGSTRFTGASGSIPANQWAHVAMVRASGVHSVYINGVANASTYTSTASYPNCQIAIGRDVAGSYSFTGYIDDFRITKGVARTITVPTAALPNKGS